MKPKILLYCMLCLSMAFLIPLKQNITPATASEVITEDSLSIDKFLQVGAEAPEFELPDQSGALVSLRAFRGKFVVIYFYPKDNTPGCTKESCDFRDNYSTFQEFGVVILGISPDSTASHVKFIANHDLPFTLLSDTSKTTLNAYGVWGRKSFAGKSFDGVIRSTVLIDPEGKVVRIWSPVSVSGHVQEVRAEVEKAVKARK